MNLNESNLILGKNNLGYRVDDFKSGNVNKLFILGLIGAGKTTISESILKETNADKLVHYDDMYLEIIKEGKINRKDMEAITKEVLKRTQEMPGKVIFEGGMATFFSEEYLLENSVVLINTSVATSFTRAWKRYYKELEEGKRKKGSFKPFKMLKQEINLNGKLKTIEKLLIKNGAEEIGGE